MARITLYRVKSEDPLELEPLQRWEGLRPEEAEARFIELIERLERIAKKLNELEERLEELEDKLEECGEG